MRLRSALATGAAPATTSALASLLLLTAAPPAMAQTVAAQDVMAHAGAASVCAGPDVSDFPVEARIHGGPASYVPGAAPGTWSLELTNTSDGACRDIHPVVVIVDRGRELRDRQILLEFRDPAAHRWRSVPFTTTDEDEHIGPFGDGTGKDGTGKDGTDAPGFDIPAGRTVSVPVRLAFTDDTTADGITANAAVVRRHGDDGDWVGDSGDYRFTVTATPSADPTGTDVPGEPVPGERVPGRERNGDIGGRTGDGPDVGPRNGAHRFAGELARTGSHRLRTVGAIACTCVLLGAALVVGSRRPRMQRRR
ncbi:hypothetical protein G3I19_26615 [Streptomyces sp. SID10853]|uniref:hypothetical protein n=1 Tax=Streptomyces sp. SID10853 TaxID=2706028 RepID=UPI0013BEF944|nr:hypothetical protein [Streptomyces sp. SID10853]NDZ82042.1 hypothetical protein [Streptomyces sp. SID10853]